MTIALEIFNRKKTILLVDDDPNFRFSMTTELRAMGYLVQGAEDGERAMRLLQENSSSDVDINLVITDLVMPRKDGLEFCRDMRKVCKDLRVLVITGYMVPEVIRELVEIGCHHYLEKPFTPTELAKKVQMLLYPEGHMGNVLCDVPGCHEC